MDKFTCVIGAGSVAVGVVIAALVYRRHRNRQALYKNEPKDTVIFYQFTVKNSKVPSFSPFPVKLETYLLMTGIPYEMRYSMEMSSKGKIPWVRYNGKVIADSQFIIDFLNKERSVDLSAHLTDAERGLERGLLHLGENSLYWTLALYRWTYDDSTFLRKTFGIPWIIYQMVKRNVKKSAHGHGIGRHTQQEVMSISYKDLQALSRSLGDKDYFLGKKPCEVDCSLFGMLSQIVYNFPGSPMESWVKEDFKNLEAYVERVKNNYWPDWDKVVASLAD